jgi:hypothetical protein
LSKSRVEFVKKQLSNYSKALPLEDLPKFFKGLLAYNFSKANNQELPEVLCQSKVSITELFHGKLKKLVRCRMNSDKPEDLRMKWDLLQCKALSNEVPNEFIKVALEKFRKMMDTPSPSVNMELKEEVREFIQDWIQEVVTVYSHKTKKPNVHSNFQFKRSSGGNKEFCREFLTRSKPFRQFEQRFEPIVLTLTGPPGSGKSTWVKRLTHSLTKMFAVSEDNVYYRNAAVNHWDGYHGQLITVIDDCGHDTVPVMNGLGQNTNELLTLISECDYILPMAKLHDKGQKFTSPFVIITTNRLVDEMSNPNVRKMISEPAALYRRFGDIYYVTKGKAYRYVPEYNDRDQPHRDYWKHIHAILPETHTIGKEVSHNFMVSKLLQKYSSFRGVFHQQIDDSPYSFEFKTTCPDINEVSVAAIVEPLKVRLITRPQGYSY